jgi:hypothetical protein
MSNSKDSLFFVRALPNEYLVTMGKKKLEFKLGGIDFKLFKKHLKIPASAEVTSFEIECSTSNYLGVIVEGYVAWRIDPNNVDKALKGLDLYDENNPLFKTSTLICDMAKDAVRRSIAEIRVDDILRSSENLKESIEKILEDVSKWGLIVDTIGINKIYIKSENVFNDLQAEDRNGLKLISEMSSQSTENKIEQDKIEHKKTLQKYNSELKEIEIKEQIKQEQLLDEAEHDKRRLNQEKKKKEIEYQMEINFKEKESEIEKYRLEKENEKKQTEILDELESARYEYQKKRLLNDIELKEKSVEIEMKNLNLAERNKMIEGNLSDRQLIELLLDRMSEINKIFDGTNLNVFGSQNDAISSLVAPFKTIMELGKQIIKNK